MMAPCTGPAHITVLNMSGERLGPLELDAEAPLQSLRQAVRQHWGVPCAAQRFVLGSQEVEGGGSTPLGRALRLTPEDASAEVMCIRVPLFCDARAAHQAVLDATARGDHAAMAEVLAESPDLKIAADSVTHWAALQPLLVAIAAGDVEAASLLRAAGAPEPRLEPRAASLGQAMRMRDLPDVVRLLAGGADVNTRLYQGEGIRATSHATPLHACCALSHLPGAAAVAELLCRLGADLGAPDCEGDSPLAHARYFNADAIYAVLQRHGAQVKGPYYSATFSVVRRFVGTGDR